MTLKSNFFNFGGKTYKQTDGISMGPPIGPSLADTSLCSHEQILLNDYRRYCITEDLILQKICR